MFKWCRIEVLTVFQKHLNSFMVYIEEERLFADY